MFERLLTFVRSIGSREELTLSYLDKWEENTAFRNGMENAVLSALRDWAEPPTGTPDTSTVSGSTNTNGTEPDERERTVTKLRRHRETVVKP